MCTTCGCSANTSSINTEHVDNDCHAHANDHEHVDSRLVKVEQDLLSRNDRHAADNRSTLNKNKVLALNLVSSPGAGKTTLLVETIKALGSATALGVIEGDQQTDRDAQRIAATGAPSHQLNTGKGCHLDAHNVGHALEHFDLATLDTLFIENVGNLVCPAAFDLGEYAKVVVLSVTEGDDKPLKYPDMFKASSLMLINKTDLLPYVDFDLEQAIGFAKRINPDIDVIELSATSGTGFEKWLAWIAQARNTSINAEQSTSSGKQKSSRTDTGIHNDNDKHQVSPHAHG